MATITISITESPLQLLAGIPSNITLDSNIPATIFYTLNGTEPTIDSFVAVGPIEMPTDSGNVVLKAFATDGIDSSAIVTQEYITNVVPARHPHDKVTNLEDQYNKATFPFGSPSEAFSIPTRFGNTGGIIVDNQAIDRQPDGYDGTATSTGAGYLNQPKSQYQFLFSETNEIGERGRGIGTLPARVISVKPRNDNTQVEQTNTASPFFDPRALVIFQDSREEQFDPSIPRINRPYFDLEDPAKSRDGSLLTSNEAVTTTGSFLKAHFNPTDNTLTYYYYDNRVARWIISKEPYHSSQNPTVNLSGIVTRSSRGQGVGMIFKWIPFKYRHLI